MAVAYNPLDLSRILKKTGPQTYSILTHSIRDRKSQIIFHHKTAIIRLIDVFEEDIGKSVSKFLENWNGIDCFDYKTPVIIHYKEDTYKTNFFSLRFYKHYKISDIIFFYCKLEMWIK